MRRDLAYLCSLYYFNTDVVDEAAEIVKRRMVWHAAESGSRIVIRKTSTDRFSVWVAK